MSISSSFFITMVSAIGLIGCLFAPDQPGLQACIDAMFISIIVFGSITIRNINSKRK